MFEITDASDVKVRHSESFEIEKKKIKINLQCERFYNQGDF